MTIHLKHVSTIALGALAALGIMSALPTPAAAAGERFVLISHAPDSDSWWNTIKNAIKIAGEQMKVTVEHYRDHRRFRRSFRPGEKCGG